MLWTIYTIYSIVLSRKIIIKEAAYIQLEPLLYLYFCKWMYFEVTLNKELSLGSLKKFQTGQRAELNPNICINIHDFCKIVFEIWNKNYI